MATLSPELSRIRKDGTRTVVVRISHREQQRRIPTNLIVRPEDLSRDGKRIRNRSVRDRVDELLRTMYQAVESIPYFVLKKCDIDTIKQKILTYYRSTEVFKLNFFDFGKEYAADITVPATRKTYEVALSALLRYTVNLGLPDLDVNDITGDFLQGFVRYIDMEPKHYYRKGTEIVEETKISKKKGTSARAYMIKLSTIFDAAKLRYNDEDMGIIRIPRSPFERVVVKSSPSNGQKHLDLETLREMMHDCDANMYERAAIDLFVVSFALMGVNMADLYNAVPPVKGIFIYQRQKTRNRREDHAEMHVKVPDQLKPYIDRLSKHARKNYWLNLSWRYSSVSSATKTVNQLLKAWSIRHGVKPFTFYAARKSWATIARSRECGVDKALVDECLDHIGDYKLTDIYVPRDWELMWEANAKVCDLVFK